MSAPELPVDWQTSPPALVLALSRRRSQGVENGEALRACIRPALAVSTPADFLGEVTRRLPLFAALHARQLGEVELRDRQAIDRESVVQGYAALGAELVSWGERLDEVAQAELDLAISTIQRSNERLLREVPEPGSAATADLFRTTVLVEFLLLCLWNLAQSGEHPQIAGQIVYSLRYAALDHAAALRRSMTEHVESDAPLPGVDADGAEDSFWALAGTLPLFEIGDAA